ncbi:MAG: DUF1614 domain-containing protein [Burkholderiales bacterium]|uniref:DUF1614 domain-containing protein n=1 Tax=Nitrosomonas sp. TaxID=42353 RepID=UPI001D476CFB|nr:DUF1614 domain-containing protein [Nitrosomonas sp.]MCB1947887.1 DUF1614 domain-containing protein [Nitrosomonas sp.]MCP5242437.1 DUF1614 domain-containing protein [Burkholderiales bacterium]
MKSQFSSLHLIFFLFLLGILLVLIQLELLAFAFEKLNLSSEMGLIILLLSLLGSVVNLPVLRIQGSAESSHVIQKQYWSIIKIPIQPYSNETLISVNLGGCLIPLALSIYLFVNSDLTLPVTLFGIVIIAAISYYFSRPIPGLGIGMPVLVAPVSAALVGLYLSPEQSAPLAYISGTLGVLIGADLLHLKKIPHLGAPHASIGGAGTFDGIFITGIVAALLA